MVQFGHYLLSHRHPGWEPYYLDYKGLKKEISRYERVVAQVQPEDKDEMALRFAENLDSQIEKVVLFFLQQQGQLAAALQELRQVREDYLLTWKLPERKVEEVPALPSVKDSGSTSSALVITAQPPANIASAPALTTTSSSSTSGRTAGGGIQTDIGAAKAGQLTVAVVVPEETEKEVEAEMVPKEIEDLMERYRGVARSLLQLLQFVELNATGLRKILKKFDRRVGGQGTMLTGGYVSSRSQHPYSHLQQMFKQVGLGAMVGTIIHNLDELHRLKHKWQQRAALSPSSRPLLTPRFSLYDIDDDAVAYVAEQEPIIKEIEAARAKLSSAISFSSYVARGLLLPAPPARVPEEEPEFHWWSLQLNQVNTFLYMVNYYIIVPTSDEYAVDLSAPASLCGAIIGATPLCALVSAFVFSRWSNRSYWEPLVVSTVVLLLGNFCYAAALDFHSVALLLLGRALTGLGGVRAINRRYIADHVPTAERTSASAGFVSAGAVGMAAGPFVAGLTHKLQFKLLGFTFNKVTSPGWLMLLSWLLYLLCVLFFFKEPSRAHLKHTTPSSSSLAGPRKSSSAQGLQSSREAGGGEGSTGSSKRRNSSGALVGGRESTADARSAAGSKEAEIRTWLLTADGGEVESKSAVSEEDDEDEDRGGAVETFSELMGELTAPIQVLLFLYFMIKFATEVLVSESSLISKFYFQWTINDIGAFLGLLGLTVLPISSAVGNFITNIYEDRLVVVWTQVIIAVGVALGLYYGPLVPFTTEQYVVTAVVIFVSCNVLEGVSLSLLSRIMSPRLSRGTFNCGLLSTEAGTFARVVGDGLISLTGYLGTGFVLNLTMLPVLITVLVALALFRMHYSSMF